MAWGLEDVTNIMSYRAGLRQAGSWDRMATPPAPGQKAEFSGIGGEWAGRHGWIQGWGLQETQTAYYNTLGLENTVLIANTPD